jgi:SAM-dependent methyltransferase
MSRIALQIKTALSHYLRGRYAPFHPQGDDRTRLRRYISGKGIEVGALHNPMNLKGLPVTEILYVDRFSKNELRQQYPDLKYLKLVPVDIIDDGEVLDKIENESLDFIIANHFLEHARNPLGTIAHWVSKLKPDGIIFTAVPDKRFMFDVNHDLTPLRHLIADYRSTPETRLTRDRQHFVEWAALVDRLPAEKIAEHVDYLIEADYSIHFHTFTLQSFLEMLDYLRLKRKLPLVLKACVDGMKDSGEFIVVMMRT